MNKKKAILQYDLDGNFIKEYSSASEIVNLLQVKASSISMCCTGKTQSVKEFTFRYKKENIVPKIDAVILSTKPKRGVYNITTNTYYDSVKDAAKDLELNVGTLTSCLYKGHLCGGFKWKFVD